MGWVSADEALGRLSVKPQTLYAYVSRGRIGVRPDPSDPRRSVYATNDIERLVTRKRRGRAATAIAAGALSWGEPVVASGVSTIADGRLIYRGRDAVEWAGSETLEATARLLWEAPDDIFSSIRTNCGPNTTGHAQIKLMAALARRAETDPSSLNRPVEALNREAAEVLGAALDAVAGPSAGPAHLRLARAWRVEGAGPDVIRRALVLAADHELNASTFAARVTASTGASLAASVMAGLCALSGPLHGGMTAHVQAFMVEARREGAERTVAAWLERGVPIPGFHHSFYPDGDVRAEAILGTFQVAPEFLAVAEALERAKGVKPNIDFALVALASTFRMPADAPFAMFALGRTVGWLAHAVEQRRTGGLIRPRAHYTGPALHAA